MDLGAQIQSGTDLGKSASNGDLGVRRISGIEMVPDFLGTESKSGRPPRGPPRVWDLGQSGTKSEKRPIWDDLGLGNVWEPKPPVWKSSTAKVDAHHQNGRDRLAVVDHKLARPLGRVLGDRSARRNRRPYDPHCTRPRSCSARRRHYRPRRCTLQRAVDFLLRRPVFDSIALYLHRSCYDANIQC
jgi:hypothetical protein